MEKVEKKRPRRGLKRKTAALLLLALIAAAGTGAYFLRRPVVPPLEEGAPKAALFSRPEEEVSSVSVALSAGESYTILLQEEGKRLQGMEEMPLRERAMQELLQSCAELHAEEAVLDTREDAVQLADFGLDPALSRVTVAYRDGESRTLRLGVRTPDELPQRYCMLEGDGVIYSVLEAETDVFFRKPDDLRDFTQPDLRADLLDRITVAGAVELEMRYTPSGWLLERPFAYPLNRSRTDALLKSIETMGFSTCLGEAAGMELNAFGLAEPALTVTLTQAATVVSGETQDGQAVQWDVPEMQYTLYLGDETGESGVYALWDGSVYVASNFVMGFWKELRVDPLLLRQPVNFLINDLNRLSFTLDASDSAYEVEMVESITENNQIATDEYGQVLYDAAVRRAGTKDAVDAEAFLNWYQRLAALAPAGVLPEGYEPRGDVWCRIRLENDALTREITFTPYDALHSAMAVNGVSRYYVENSALRALLPAP